MEYTKSDWYIDIVMCIDKTGSMRPFIDQLRCCAHQLLEQIFEDMENRGKTVGQLRVKVIAFGDYHWDEEPMIETPFFKIPEQEDDLQNFLDHLEVTGGGDRAENALEALALALKSNWTTEGRKQRHVIFVCSDAEPHKLGLYADLEGYPKGMPADFEQLVSWWEGTDPNFTGTYKPDVGRLLAFVPQDSEWSRLENFNFDDFNRFAYVVDVNEAFGFAGVDIWEGLQILRILIAS